MKQSVILLIGLFICVQASTDDESVNLIVRYLNESRRYCVEIAQLPNGRAVNVTGFGWHTPYIAAPSVNGCNITDLKNSLPSFFPKETILVIQEHDCKMTQHAWNVEEIFGSEIALMVVTKRANTRFSLTYNVTAMPVSIATLIFYNDDFIQMNKTYQNLSETEFSIVYAPEISRKFRPATLLMFLLVFLVFLAGNFWAADEFKRLIQEQRVTRLDTGERIVPIVHQSVPSSTQPIKSDSVSPDQTSDHSEPPIIPMTYCLIAFILCFAVGWLLLIFYFPKVMIYILQVLFCIGAFSSCTSCFDRLTCFIPKIRTYQLPMSCFCKKCSPINVCTIGSITMSLALVIIWYIFRFADWSWILQDVLGAAVCVSVISIYRLGNMRVITFILLGFFLYDIFFVFITPFIPIFQASSGSSTNYNSSIPFGGTFTNGSSYIVMSTPQKPSRSPSVMEQVALGIGTNGEIVPLLFALPLFIPNDEIDPCQTVRKSMLGFGDVILPGILLTFCKIFDIASAHKWPIYYTQSVLAYFTGLILTHIALALMNTAQPALLYLVPCILVSTIITGLIRGELKELYSGNRISNILKSKTRNSESSLLQGVNNPLAQTINEDEIAADNVIDDGKNKNSDIN